MEFRPQPGPQETFLSSPADIAIYGGANGGGKTWALLMEAIRHIDNPQYGAVIFRRETPQITNEGGMWDESFSLYPHLGAKPTQQPYHQWNFPSGAAVTMTHLQYEKTIYGWDGSQIPMLGFDQLEQFTKKQVFYMFGRMRSTSGVRPYMRATCNPDPDCFLVDWDNRDKGVEGQGLIDWWIGEDGFPIVERSGVIRYLANIKDVLHWGDTREELIAIHGEKCRPKSITFIASTVYDNKILMDADPDYLGNLLALPLEDQMRKLHGNWRFKSEGGKVKRSDIIHLQPNEPIPDMVRVVVAVDPSGSSKVNSSSVGITVCGKGVDGRGYIIEDLSGVLSPQQWANRAVNAYDHYRADLIVGERNFGGDMVENTIKGIDANVNFKAVTASRGKIVRLEPIAAFYARKQIVHCKHFKKLENQLCSYDPEKLDKSPDEMDSAVWGLTELMLSGNTARQIKLRGH